MNATPTIRDILIANRANGTNAVQKEERKPTGNKTSHYQS